MNRLLVAFETETACNRIREMLDASGLQVRSAHRTGAEVVRAVRLFGGGVVVCGAKLLDMTADQLLEDLEGMAYVLVVAKIDQMARCESPDLFRLPLPLNRYDLAASVRMLQQMEEMALRRKAGRSQQDLEDIEEAKRLLYQNTAMDEAQAHRYLQKSSMDSGRRIAETARLVIESYAKRREK